MQSFVNALMGQESSVNHHSGVEQEVLEGSQGDEISDSGSSARKSDKYHSSDIDEDYCEYVKGGYHNVHIGDTFKNGRFLVKKKLGWGHFSTVWLVRDKVEKRYCAMKVQKSAKRYTLAALDEIKLLRAIDANQNKPGQLFIVGLFDHFMHKGHNGEHMCMVFECLGDNLLKLIKLYDYRGIPMRLVRQISYQLLLGLTYLHDTCNIIHTDLKPENVLIAGLHGKEFISQVLHNLPSLSALHKVSGMHLENDTGKNDGDGRKQFSLNLNQRHVVESRTCEDKIVDVGKQLNSAPVNSDERKKLKKKLKKLKHKQRKRADGHAGVVQINEVPSQCSPFTPDDIKSGTDLKAATNHQRGLSSDVGADASGITPDDIKSSTDVKTATNPQRVLSNEVGADKSGITLDDIKSGTDLKAATNPQRELSGEIGVDASGIDGVCEQMDSLTVANETSTEAVCRWYQQFLHGNFVLSDDKSSDQISKGQLGNYPTKYVLRRLNPAERYSASGGAEFDKSSVFEFRMVVPLNVMVTEFGSRSSPDFNFTSTNAKHEGGMNSNFDWVLSLFYDKQDQLEIISRGEVTIKAVCESNSTDTEVIVGTLNHGFQSLVDYSNVEYSSRTLVHTLFDPSVEGPTFEWRVQCRKRYAFEVLSALESNHKLCVTFLCCPPRPSACTDNGLIAIELARKLQYGEQSFSIPYPTLMNFVVESFGCGKCAGTEIAGKMRGLQLNTQKRHRLLEDRLRIFGILNPALSEKIFHTNFSICQDSAFAKHGESEPSAECQTDSEYKNIKCQISDAQDPDSAIKESIQEDPVTKGNAVSELPSEVGLQSFGIGGFPSEISCKIVDFGNACFRDQRYMSTIQTRQYRCPEAIIDAGYDTSSDLWSLACLIFELATGDVLFDPEDYPNAEFSRDEDHLALMIELLGPMPQRFALGGAKSRKFFDRKGKLKNVSALKFWSLSDVLQEKYKFTPESATSFADFLLPMLSYLPKTRSTAKKLLENPWLKETVFSASEERMERAGYRDLPMKLP